MKNNYSKKYLNDIINIVELLKNQQTHSLAYKLMILFLTKYKINVDSEINILTKKKTYIKDRYRFLSIDNLSLYFDTNKPYSIFYQSAENGVGLFVIPDNHLVFNKYEEDSNAYHVEKNCNDVIRCINDYKNKVHGD